MEPRTKEELSQCQRLLFSASEVKEQLGKESSLPSPVLIPPFLGLGMQASYVPFIWGSSDK